jgi:hypothetical protein
MENTSRKLEKPSRRDAAYYRQRQKNRVYAALAEFFAEEAGSRDITRKDVAEATGRDAAQITRWLNGPTNLELDTISDFLLPFGAEMDHRIVRFKDRLKPNMVHPLMEGHRVSTSTAAPLRMQSLKIKAPASTKVESKIIVESL